MLIWSAAVGVAHGVAGCVNGAEGVTGISKRLSRMGAFLRVLGLEKISGDTTRMDDSAHGEDMSDIPAHFVLPVQ